MICVTLNSLLEDAPMIKTLIRIFRAGQETVMFVPMLAVLFIGCRMRALQLTRADDGTIPPSAGPQPWAQKAMYAASLSLLVQIAMTMLVEIVHGSHHEASLRKGGARVSVTPRDGQNEGLTAERITVYVIEVVHFGCLIAMYGGACVIIAAIFMMTPE